MTTMQQITAADTDKTPAINENFESVEHQACYAKDPNTTSALTWGYLGGRWSGFAITAATLTLTNTTTNYVVVARATGVVSTSTTTTNWNDTGRYARVYKLTTAGGVVTAAEDHRGGMNGVHGQAPSANSYAVAGGTNSYTITPLIPITDYAAGQAYNVAFTNANTGAATLQISGVATPPALVKLNSSGAYVALVSGDIPAGLLSAVCLISATQALVMDLVPAASGGGGGSLEYLSASGTNSYAITPSTAITAYTAGQNYLVAFPNANTGAATLQISGVATPPAIVKLNTSGAYVALASGDIPAGMLSHLCLLSATQALLMNQVPAAGGSGASLSTAQTWTAAQRGGYSVLTYGSTITPDFSAANNYRVQLTGNPTLANPTNLVAGQSGAIDVYQDTTGSRVVSYAWGYQAPYGVLPVITTTARSKTKILYSVDVYSTATVTVTIASPGVVSWTAHGLMAGQPVQFTTTGALPTGLAANTTYFVVPVNADGFQLSATQSGSAINTSGSQSGTHTMTAISITLSGLGAVS